MIRRLFAKRVTTGEDQRAKGGGRPRTEGTDSASTAAHDLLRELLDTVEFANASGRHGVSLRAIHDAMLADPNNPELVFARAATLLGWGRYWEALWAYESLRTRGWTHQRLPLQFGYVHLALGHLADAEAWMRQALELDPDDTAAKDGLINALMHQGRATDAIAAWEEFFGPGDQDPRRLNWIVYCKADAGDFESAESHARRLLANEANEPGVWVNLGIALAGLGRRQEALQAFREAMRLDDLLGTEIDAFVNVAKQSMMLGRLDTCIEILETRLPRRPSTEGHLVYAEALLKAGRFAEGWEQYEFRWMRGVQAHLRHGPSRPVWNGQDPRGRTIFVRKEQGVGDSIQFIRYLPLLKQLDARVLLQKLPGISMTFKGVDHILEPEESRHYDYYINFLSLPRVFETELDNVPCNIPYLWADAERMRCWSKRLGSGDSLRVGLVWAGNPIHIRDADRSMPLQAMRSLFELGDVRYFALQKGAGTAQYDTFEFRDRLENLADGINDFADTAAIISQLDLIISVDTAVAHLAGALGRPIWLLLQKDGEWRWLSDDRIDSPWYPTMRIFRQSTHDDWYELVQRVKAALQKVASSGEQLTAISSASVSHAQPPRADAITRAALTHSTIPTLAVAAEGRAGLLQYFPTDLPESDCLSWYGDFLQPQLDLIFTIIKPGSTVVEIAPGIGAHALQIANRLGPQGHLFLFEPRAVLHRVLQQNLAVNAARNVTVLRRRPGRRAVTAPQGIKPALGEVSACVESTDALDDYLFEQLHLLKIGNGAEIAAVLDGATETVWRLRPVIFVAVTDDQAVDSTVAIVNGLGYRCWRMETPLFSPDNFNRRTDDIFCGKDAIALIAIPEELDVDIDLRACIEV